MTLNELAMDYDNKGFDLEAQGIIAQRETAIQELLGDLNSEVSEDVCLRLAERLGLEAVVIHTRLAQHCRTGLFDRSGKERARGTALSLEQIEAVVLPILARSRDVTRWVIELRDSGICRDDGAAHMVGYTLRRSRSLALSQARRIIENWRAHGQLGLLLLSEYPFTDELFRLQTFSSVMTEALDTAVETQNLLATLRADVVALARTLQTEHLLLLYRRRYGPKAHIYDQSLLHQPPGSEARVRFRERVGVEVYSLAVVSLAALRGCDEKTAETLLTLFVEHGLNEIVQWRCADHLQDRRLHAERERVERMTKALIGGLTSASQYKINIRLQHLLAAVVETSSTLSIAPFIRDLPSSPRRRRLQRRRIPDEVVQAFAVRLDEPSSSAWSYIRNLRIYGPLGMLRPSEWQRAIHRRLWSYLNLFKMGRVEDTVDEGKLTGAVNRYGVLLREQPLARQVVAGMYRHFSKDHYYNSGDGEGIAGVPLRKSLNISGVYRLHERWLVLPVPLDVQPVDMGLHPIGERSIVTLVLDWGSQRPLTVWVSPERVGELEVGLALLHAIWHPDALDWPLRGIPEHIFVSQELVEANLATVRQAADYLLASVTVTEDARETLKELPFARGLLEELREAYQRPKLGRHRGQARQVTIPQLREEIRTWLYQRCFPDHRTVPVPANLRRSGFVLPGFDTPAAGWLLPYRGVFPTVRNGVEFEGLSYTDSATGIEPGLEVDVRAFGNRPGAIFAAYNGTLHYLTRSSRKRVE